MELTRGMSEPVINVYTLPASANMESAFGPMSYNNIFPVSDGTILDGPNVSTRSSLGSST